MKKITTLFASMMLFAGLTAAFTSCSDDDNNEPEIPAAKSVAGTYTGDMSCTVMGDESTFEDMTFTVTATDDATVTVKIPTFGNPPMQVPAFDIQGVKVSGTDGTYSLADTDFQGTTAAGREFSGTLQGSFTDQNLTIRFSLNYGAMPMPMICAFSAPKQ